MRFIKRLSTTFYADEGISFLDLRFENDVKMYGTQAVILWILVLCQDLVQVKMRFSSS